MAAFSTYLANKVLDHINGRTAYTMPTVYVALMTTAPTAAGGGVEASYTGYARVALSGLIGAAASGSDTDTSAITFGADTSGTSSVVDFATYDASTGGNLLIFGTSAYTITPGTTPSFPASALTVSLV